MRPVLATVVLLCLSPAVLADVPDWVAPMQAVHAGFTGPAGRISRFGDSITVSKAFWNPLQWAHTNTGDQPGATAALNWIRNIGSSHIDTVIWSWQDSYQIHGAEGSTTAAWPMTPATGWAGALAGERKIDYWLRVDRPEMAVVMYGSNDMPGTAVSTFKSNMQTIAQVCMAAGTVPILTTPPPKHGVAISTSDPFAQAVRDLGTTLHVPVIDYYQDILTRNPDPSWDGKPLYDANPAAYGNNVYAVLTSISGDGVHPSNPSAWSSNFSNEALQKNGFNERNFVTLMKCYEVYQEVIVPEPTTLLLLAVGGLLALRRRR